MLPMQVRGGQLWGTDVYTVDSDLVAGIYFVNIILEYIKIAFCLLPRELIHTD